MKIAIIGSGISGLSTAFYLSKFSDITLFEKNKKFGGHANTYDFNFENKNIPIDCGFIVYNKKNYPNFIKILDYLNVPSNESDMSFAMSVDKNFVHSYCFGLALTANLQRLAASSLRFKAAAVKECQKVFV